MLELIENGNTSGLCLFIAIRAVIVMVCWAMMLIACLIDLWDARKTALLLGERIESHKYRKTITKAGDYSRVLMFVLMFDMLGFLFSCYKLPFASIICTVAILFIEGKSVIEHMQKKKAHAAEIPDIIKNIIKASSTKEAEHILNELTGQHGK